MSIKSFFFKIKKNIFLKDTVLNSTLYPKYLVRKKIDSVVLLDDNCFVLELYNKKNNILGYSFFSKQFCYQHVLFKALKINNFIPVVNYNLYVERLYATFDTANKKNLNSCLILGAKKGGFKVYYSGLKAFLPFGHFLRIIKKNFFLLKKSTFLSKILVYITCIFFVRKFFLFRSLLVLSTTGRLFFFKRKRFVLYKKNYKKKFYRRGLNIVVLEKKLVFLSANKNIMYEKKNTLSTKKTRRIS